MLATDKGVALIAVLLLIVVVGIISATILETTTTEISISKSFKSSVQSFYLAEAGLQEARAQLQEHTTTGASDHDAFKLISSLSDKNAMMGIVENQQSEPSYQVKVHQKTEYDAEQNGHRARSPHYTDNDGNRGRHSPDDQGNSIFWGYPTIHLPVPVQFVGRGMNGFFPVMVVASTGLSEGGNTRIVAELAHYPGPKLLGALCAGNSVTLTGNSSMISGRDSCGKAPSVPPIFSSSKVTYSGDVTFDGEPSTPVQGHVAVNLSGSIHVLKSEALPVNASGDLHQFGNETHYANLYNGNSQKQPFSRLTLQNTTGYGILLSDGDVILGEGVTWEGMIVSTGTITFKGGHKGIRIRGAVWANDILQHDGQLDIQYDSCRIKRALQSRPLTVLQWREEF